MPLLVSPTYHGRNHPQTTSAIPQITMIRKMPLDSSEAAVGAVSCAAGGVSVCAGEGTVTSGTIGHLHSEEPRRAQREDEDEDSEDDRVAPRSAVRDEIARKR